MLEPCVMYDRRVLVPSALRQEVLKGLHAAHQGVVSMSNRAQQVVFWPGIFKDLETVRAACRDCCVRAQSQQNASSTIDKSRVSIPYANGRLF